MPEKDSSHPLGMTTPVISNEEIFLESYFQRRREGHEEKLKWHVTFDQLSNKVIGCAIEVHRELDPGLLESAYE